MKLCQQIQTRHKYSNVEKGLGDNIFVQRVLKFFQKVNDMPFWVRPKLGLPSQGPCQDHHGATPMLAWV